ncbi:dipeptidase [Nitratireductor mangrovi]|uniref:Dipeptidase n=1 Tax=Nitratireductor mangrovi TaxID=2599600 RepID=A0A5B8KUC9_9HYPH|nr:membrane dipeptidase [Nitratireductor mangrovi]QDY99159.1 dipeptidase [Nitratireductor mangrovi]
MPTTNNGTSRLIVDGLSMPAPERRWLEAYRNAGLACVNTCVAVWENAGEALSVLGRWRRLVEENSDLAAIATSVAEVRDIADSGRTAILFGFQNTAPIEHNIDLFGAFRRQGVCIMQLTYNLQNYIGCGYWEEKDTGVSSRFGAKAIEEMNRNRILIDLSHCGERTTLDAIEMSTVPVAITHANPREYVGSPVYGSGRLKTTEALKALSARNGVIGLTPNRNMTKRGAETTLEEFGDMIAWAVDRFGIETVAIGSDYCPGHPRHIRTWWRYARWSRESAPAEQMKVAPHEGWSEWMKTQEGMHNIVAELDRRGFRADEVDAVMGGNWMRLFEQTIG